MFKWLAVMTLMACANAQAWQCKYDKDIDLVLDVSDSTVLKLSAVGGELTIKGKPGTDEVVVRGEVCVSKEEWLDEVSIESKFGDRAEIWVVTPDTDGWTIGSRYAIVNLEVTVPDSLDLDVKDSSGDLVIEDVAAVRLKDSSGDIRIENASGPVIIDDSSGDIEVRYLAEDLTIESDSSGAIRGTDIDGSVLVERDSSGDIRFTHVGRDVVIERDSSGDIEVDDVQGDFTVHSDGSGSIDSRAVAGETNIPKNKRS